MATALVDALSPTSESRAGQERQFSHHENGLQREVERVEQLEATAEMCAYCFGERRVVACWQSLFQEKVEVDSSPAARVCRKKNHRKAE